MFEVINGEKKPSLDSKIAGAKKKLNDRSQNFGQRFGVPHDLKDQQRPNLKVIQGGNER